MGPELRSASVLSLAEELAMCLLICTKQPKQAKSADKEGAKPVNVDFFFFFLTLGDVL